MSYKQIGEILQVCVIGCNSFESIFRQILSSSVALRCSPQTVAHRRKEAGQTYRHSLPQDQLISVIDQVCHLTENGRAYGYRIAQSALFGRAQLRVTGPDVLNALKAHDPAASAARRERILHRRTYDVVEAMMLWHMDSKSSPCLPTLQSNFS